MSHNFKGKSARERDTAVHHGEGSWGLGDVVRMGEMADQAKKTTCLHGGSPARLGWRRLARQNDWVGEEEIRAQRRRREAVWPVEMGEWVETMPWQLRRSERRRR